MPDRLDALIDADRIAARIRELAAELDRDYVARSPLVVGVLNGAFVFLADLLRSLTISPTVDFLRAGSYGAATETTGVVRLLKDLETPILDRDVLLVEDIVDTGLTLDFLRRHIEAGNPRSLAICTLLDKKSRRRVPIDPDYVGFEIEDLFVVGYGLDYAGRYRELPDIRVLTPGE